MVLSAFDVAVSTTVEGLGTVVGAVYCACEGPEGVDTVPHVVPEQPAPERDHTTLWFATSFCTVAVKNAVVPATTFAVGGATLTEMLVTVKFKPLLGIPATVTTTFPVVAPLGTGTVIELDCQIVGFAVVPLNVTVLPPCGEPKPAPVILTEVPTAPEVGLKFVIAGPGMTVKLTPLLERPPAVTTTLPVVAPFGMVTSILVGVQLIAPVTGVPLKVTVPMLLPKFVPVIVTEVPTLPDVGFKPVITGAAAVPFALLKAAKPAAQSSAAAKRALAEALPGAA